ncbi:MAG TPA: cytochrome c [Chthonomonadaceae bacterium]|nr:cytochrome c [Chthonomonadaceae bacterium]
MAFATHRTVASAFMSFSLFGILLTTVALAKPPAAKPSAAEIAAGKTVYDKNKCTNCHMIASKGGKSGPDLSNVGTTRTAAWLEAEIKDPSSHKADSAMPAYGEKIKGKDLSNLVAYLGSLKKK